jgi:tetratricopeptide (TPR) repeat protein
MAASSDAALPRDDVSPATLIRTTDGTIALLNLQAQIEPLERLAAQGQLPIRQGAELVDLLSLRGQILGRIADYEGAAERAEQMVGDFAADRVAFLARARMRALMHRFEEALIDLDAAERLGAAGPELDAERAAIFQAVGRYDEAMALRRAAVERRETFETLGGLAALHAECGEIDAAERRFDESRGRFRGVSPFPLTQLEFQRGHMWQEQGDLRRARDWFTAAWRRLPAYAPAEGHLAEVEADLGEPEAALARLRRLADASDDPDYAAQLARLLRRAGRLEEARAWRARAAARYDELVARHLAAFADHAAEFWLEAGDDPHRALWLARRNLEARRTPRAHELLARATLASDLQ